MYLVNHKHFDLCIAKVFFYDIVSVMLKAMKKAENGFAVLEALLITLIIAILGFTCWFVFHAKSNAEKSLNSNNSTAAQFKKQTTSKISSQPTTNKSKIDSSGLIHEVDIKLQTEADISKLPDYTPASFKTYMLGLLQKNTPSEYGCIEVYSISKISPVNIAGGGNDVNATNAPKDADCIGGAPIIWALTPAGTWDQDTLNGYPCKTDNGGLIYEEFVAKCYNNSNNSYYANPNGSVASIKN